MNIAKRKRKVVAIIFPSASVESFFLINLEIVIIVQRPPSRAGIGRTFIQAREMEMMAVRKSS